MNRRRIWLLVLFGLLTEVVAFYISTDSKGRLVAAPAPAPKKIPMPAHPPVSPEVLEPGKAITRTVWGESRFVFQGDSGEAITLRVTGKTPGLDPRVVLIDPEFEKEAVDDDSGGHGNSLIERHVLKHKDRYTVKVELAKNEQGQVEVLLEKPKPLAH